MPDTPPHPVALACHAMATRFEVVLFGPEATRLRAAGEEALEEIQRLEAQLSAYRADSEISSLNARAAGGWVGVDPRLFRLLQRALALQAATDGAFDPTMGPLLRAWGFQGGSGKWADEADVNAARALAGPGRILLDEGRFAVRFDRPGVSLDLGALGKGFAVDQAVSILREAGVESALLHGGTSTVAGIGAPPDGDAWPIAIADPTHPEHLLAVARLSDGEALSVSGVHGKSFLAPDGEPYGHVLDPRSGYPVHGARLSAVTSRSATDTDALSTALLVLGAPGLPVIRRAEPSAGALVLSEGALTTIGSGFERTER